MRRVNRAIIPGSNGLLRPILPAPMPAPNPSQITGPSTSRTSTPVSQPPSTFRPILPAPARPPETSLLASSSAMSQARSPPPPAVAPTVERMPLPSQSAELQGPSRLPEVHPAPNVSAASPQPPLLSVSQRLAEAGLAQSSVSQTTQTMEIEAAQSQGDSAGLPGGEAISQHPRPRPRRKQALQPSEAPAEHPSSSVPRTKGAEHESQASASTRKGKGRAKGPTREAPAGQIAHQNTRQSTKRVLDAGMDGQPSKRRQTKKRTSIVDSPVDHDAGVADTTGDTPNPSTEVSDQTTHHSNTAAARLASPAIPGGTTAIDARRDAEAEAVLTSSMSRTNRTGGDGRADAVDTEPIRRKESKKGRNAGPETTPVRRQPLRRSTRLQHAVEDPSTNCTAP
ncbi:hypothetical protein DAEQUDRAFT_594688 [Daedalea quercina L-15889]|uniref:Uncharacterized protein n=1 Tax=Daedalea quercina L-15889 TaxID=1314783 RepID=A0A165SY73_9APHY|nr:hypothetical protein DAEQUDRAFT_594688 [Daedalea quercina L-15889]